MNISNTARTLANQHSKADYLNHAFPMLAILAALTVFLKNAWAADDAYIYFRIVEQLFAGNGPNFNPHERAMVYTSPAWYWLLCAGRLFTTDLYIVSITLSLILWAATLAVLKYALKSWLPFALAVLLMLSSNGFYDSTSSGLETPLAYLAVAVYGMFYIRRIDGKNDALPLLLTVGVAILVRHDIATLLLAPTAYAVWQDRHNRSIRQWVTWTIIALAPITTWTMFSLVYYGFPFPNTMYAKTNIDLPRHAIILQHGVNYWIDNLQRDIVTPFATFLAMGAAVIAPATVRKPALALAAGIATNCAYVTYIGGDFMIGRFIANAFLLSVFTIYLCMRNDGVKRERPKLWYGRTAAVLLALAVVNLQTHTPINAPKDWETYDDPNGAIDIRGWRFPETSLHQYFAQRKSGAFFPDANTAHSGLNIKHDTSGRVAHIVGGMGMSGYHAGTDKVIFDVYGLSSPLLARMDGDADSWVGHYRRDIPQDLLLAHEQGTDIIKDPEIRHYYGRMQLVTQSRNLLAPERLREILLLNTVHRKLHLAYTNEESGG